MYRADKLRAAQAVKMWTDEQVAEKAGVTPLTVSLTRKGNPNIKLGTLNKIAGALGVSMADLFEEEDQQQATA